MRFLPALLLLAAAPALAQQGPVDPALVGTWTFEFFETGGIPPNAEVEFASVTFMADGRLIAQATATLDGERTSRTQEDAFWTTDGLIHTPNASPVAYEFVGPDDLRMTADEGVTLRFRRASQ